MPFIDFYVYILRIKQLAKPHVTNHCSSACGGRNLSQVVKAQLQLREMMLAGEMAAGERISELVLAERLGISRTRYVRR